MKRKTIKQLEEHLEHAYRGNREDRAAHDVTKKELEKCQERQAMAWEIVEAFTKLINR